MLRWGRMRRVLSLFGGICIVLALAASSLEAAEDRKLFEVRDIKVDVSAQTGTAARELALAEGERKAFQALLDRLTLPRDQGAQRRFAPSEISATTKDFWVSEEKVSPVRYIATLNYEFHGGRVRELLSSKGIPFVTAVAPTVLVVPLYQQQDQVRLWQPPNPWHDAWISIPARGLVPIAVPKPAAGDAAPVDPPAALKADDPALADLARRYDTSDLVVAQATLAVAPTAPEQQLTVIIRRKLTFGPTAETSATYQADAKEPLSDLLKRAAAATLVILENDWKEANRPEVGGSGVMAVDVSVSDLRTWIAVQKAFERVPGVRRIDPVLFAKGRVRVNLSHSGTAEQVAASLERAGFAVAPNGDTWTARPLGGAPGGAGPG